METEIFLKLIFSVFLGASIGLEREFKRKGAGLQTYSLVALGSCLFATITFSLAEKGIIDPSIIIMAVAVGMGFIGAGAIFKGDTRILGLTTAAGLWTASAIGLAVASGFYFLAAFCTFLVILILAGFGFVENKFFKI